MWIWRKITGSPVRQRPEEVDAHHAEEGVQIRALLEAGATLFDEAKFWHAHEAWEDLWNDLKRRAASQDEILLVQGLIQTAALLLHHQRRNVGGVEKQWAKLQPKLEGWTDAWGFDIATHLAVIQTYAEDNTTWNLTASDHQLPRA